MNFIFLWKNSKPKKNSANNDVWEYFYGCELYNFHVLTNTKNKTNSKSPKSMINLNTTINDYKFLLSLISETNLNLKQNVHDLYKIHLNLTA